MKERNILQRKDPVNLLLDDFVQCYHIELLQTDVFKSNLCSLNKTFDPFLCNVCVIERVRESKNVNARRHIACDTV